MFGLFNNAEYFRIIRIKGWYERHIFFVTIFIFHLPEVV